MEYYKKLRYYREKKEYTQEDLAEELGIDAVNYGRIERGQTKLTIERLFKIAEILDFDISDFFENEIQKNEKIDMIKKIEKNQQSILNELKSINNKLIGFFQKN